MACLAINKVVCENELKEKHSINKVLSVVNIQPLKQLEVFFAHVTLVASVKFCIVGSFVLSDVEYYMCRVMLKECLQADAFEGKYCCRKIARIRVF